jgi:hypothetical protein
MRVKHKCNGGRLAAAAVMVALWGALCALEVSPDLHRLLHGDAQSPGHTCLVTQMQQHLLLSGFAVATAPPLPSDLCGPLTRRVFQFLPSHDYRLSPSRAPPAV